MGKKTWLTLGAATLAPFWLAAGAEAQLGSFSATFWSAESPGIVLPPDEGAAFGRALAAGDFDCDGLDDLVIGAPFQDFFVDDDSGAVLVLYGRLGLGPTPDHFDVFRQNSITSDGIQADDRFGLVLAAGDFDSNDCSDLAIGTPNEDIDGQLDSGAAFVIYGGPDGLGEYGSDFWHPVVLGDASGTDDQFGAALAVGDFDGDGWGDLAIGNPGRAFNGVDDVGRVFILYGSASGLDGDVDSFFDQVPFVSGRFGAALAAGEFLPTPGDELAVGTPSYPLPGLPQAGAVAILSDIASGFPTRSRWHEDSAGVPGTAEAGDQFGTALAAGDFDGDGVDEVAVGTPLEVPKVSLTKGGLALGAGAVTILDLDGGQHQHWTQDQLAPEVSEFADDFGRALAASDFDGDGIHDLAIGADGEDRPGAEDSGIVHVLYGRPGQGLDSSSDQIWAQLGDTSETDDTFGFALATGDFDGVGAADLAAGAPLESLDTVVFAGAVSVWFSNLPVFDDGFESGDTSAWSSTIP